MKTLLLFLAVFCCFYATAQLTDSTVIYPATIAKDSLVKKEKTAFNPRKATIRSAILPGWGQLYNKKYWKAPLVWGALGTTAGIYIYNVKNYRLLKDAYIYLSDNDQTNDGQVDPRFRNLSKEAIRSYRNSFRQNVDYSVLFFFVFWGLNVVDATVDAHLKSFDVDDNLSLHIKAGYSEMARTAGISLVLNFNKTK